MSGHLRSSDGGYVLVVALVAVAVMAVLAAGAAGQANSAVRTADRAVRSEQALYLADAGVQRVIASPPVALADGASTTFRASNLDPDLSTAAYVVQVRREGDFLVIRSTGTAARGRTREVRTVGDRLYAPLPETDPADPDDPGGTDPGGTDPGDGRPLIFRQAIWAGGPVDIKNNASICGDIVTTGKVTVKNNATIWGKAKTDHRGSPCKTVAGTGRVVSADAVDIRNNATVQGGYCAPGHQGPCESVPRVDALRPPRTDVAALKAQATEWWVQKTFDCAGRPEGTSCKAVSSGSHKLTGAIRYSEPTLIYVDGDLLLENGVRVEVSGPVTFVINGKVTVQNNARLTCGGSAYCPVGLIVTGDVEFAQNTEVHAFVHTDAELRGMNNAVLYGNVIARTTNFSKNNYVQQAFSAPVGVYPPGLLLESGSEKASQ